MGRQKCLRSPTAPLALGLMQSFFIGELEPKVLHCNLTHEKIFLNTRGKQKLGTFGF